MDQPLGEHQYDVAILGGGLAGGSLARQLSLEAPALRVAVIETRKHPVREAAFKVGESSVEIGAHYFQCRLGLEPHLRARQLEKLGLRYFFTEDDNRDITRRTELGPAAFPPVPSFQLDRGRFENMLLEVAAESGISVFDGCKVNSVALARDGHTVSVTTPAGDLTIRARWVVDASGRRGLIKRQLGLDRTSTHGANACWFRVRSRLRVDDWSDDPAWRARVPSGERWLSTNHLMGTGYWVWLIPLGSGSTSVGIVADGDIHSFPRINRFERAMEWLREFEPQCADVIAAHSGELEDFLALQHYAHSCAQLFSPDRWALVGEAGVFTDPFYSPGSDFIAMGNDFVVDLIRRDTRGEDIASRVDAFNATYLRLFDAFIRLYDGQYRIMGNAQVMIAKVAWDNACYWAITALLFFQRRLVDTGFMASIDPLLRQFFVLHARMQQLLSAWDRADRERYATTAVSVLDVDALRHLQCSLADPPMDDDELRARLERNYRLLEAFARKWQAAAAERDPKLARFLAPASPGAQPADLDVSPLLLPKAALPLTIR